MSDSALPGIDHPLILVRDIEAARITYASLGFTLTPVGLHPWGTSTSLAVMQRSALELMSVYDATLLDGLEVGGFRFGRHMHDALTEREGLSLVALHSRDAHADAAAMVAGGVVSQGHIDFRRRVRPPGHDWDEAVVSLEIFLDPVLPRASHFIAQQHKPQLLWVPEWMRHANGATHIAAVTYLAEDPAPVLTRLAAMFEVVMQQGHSWEAATGQGVFRVLRPTDWAAEFAASPRPAMTAGETAGAAIDVGVADLALLRTLLADAGVATCETPRGPAVQNVAACGNVVIRFVAA